MNMRSSGSLLGKGYSSLVGLYLLLAPIPFFKQSIPLRDYGASFGCHKKSSRLLQLAGGSGNLLQSHHIKSFPHKGLAPERIVAGLITTMEDGGSLVQWLMSSCQRQKGHVLPRYAVHFVVHVEGFHRLLKGWPILASKLEVTRTNSPDW